ncbi:MAG: signal peptidase II [Pseudomonadota bacterium]
MRGGASFWLWLSAVVIGVDQFTKYLVDSSFEYGRPLTLHPMLDFTLLYNTGAAFSFLSTAGGWQRWFFIALGVAVSALILVWLARLPARGHSMLAAGLALILGGALGNVIDRALYGHVIDFISVHYETWYFPAFNVADSAITVGAALLIIDSVFGKDPSAE